MYYQRKGQPSRTAAVRNFESILSAFTIGKSGNGKWMDTVAKNKNRTRTFFYVQVQIVSGFPNFRSPQNNRPQPKKKILRIEVFEKYENCVTIKECLYRSRCGRLPVGDGFFIFSHFFVSFSLPHSFRSFHRRNACECRGLGICEVISIPPLAKPQRFECFSIAF